MMRWFTMRDWADGNHRDFPFDESLCEDRERRVQHYQRELERITPRLPADLVKADARLHDARLLSAQADLRAQTLRLLVQPYDGGADWWVYTGVRRCEWLNNEIELGGPPGFGHLGYSEYVLTEGGFEMTILFSSGLELTVEFVGFHLEPADIAEAGS